MRLRPGNPPQLDKAKALFDEKFYDENRYRLGKVGRFRANRKFHQDVPESVMTLRHEDFVDTLKYIMKLRNGEGVVDDIDHLGNRRLRTIDELAADELRKGFLKLRRTVQERMSLKDPGELTQDFGTGQLQEHLVEHRLLLRSRRTEPGGGPAEPAQPAHARTAPLGPGPRRPEPKAARASRSATFTSAITGESARSRRPKATTSA